MYTAAENNNVSANFTYNECKCTSAGNPSVNAGDRMAAIKEIQQVVVPGYVQAVGALGEAAKHVVAPTPSSPFP
jgi:hypothetical protein